MITNVATEGNYLLEYFLNSNRFCLQIFVPNGKVTPIVVILIIFCDPSKIVTQRYFLLTFVSRKMSALYCQQILILTQFEFKLFFFLMACYDKPITEKALELSLI